MSGTKESVPTVLDTGVFLLFSISISFCIHILTNLNLSAKQQKVIFFITLVVLIILIFIDSWQMIVTFLIQMILPILGLSSLLILYLVFANPKLPNLLNNDNYGPSINFIIVFIVVIALGNIISQNYLISFISSPLRYHIYEMNVTNDTSTFGLTIFNFGNSDIYLLNIINSTYGKVGEVKSTISVAEIGGSSPYVLRSNSLPFNKSFTLKCQSSNYLIQTSDGNYPFALYCQPNTYRTYGGSDYQPIISK